ncbi:MAG: hypothetical protein IPM11_01105 [Micropruina sp.]|nr:hypothetical protein [Micropruina sp.]
MPAIPTSVTVVKDATYPDHVATLSWIIPAGTLSVSVQRTWDGGMTWVRTQLGLVASYRWVDQIQDTQYGYRVRSEGVDGFSDWSAPVWLWTSPGAPSGLAVVRSSNAYVDDLLTFTCQNLSVTATAMRVQSSTDGITWMTVDTLAPARPSSSWQVVTPTDAVAYFRAANLGEGGLVSAWSNTVAIPASTSHLAPTGLIAADFDPAAASTWTWVLHPGADGSGQGRYEIQTRYYSGARPLPGCPRVSSGPHTLSHMGGGDLGHRTHLRVAGPHLRREHGGRAVILVCYRDLRDRHGAGAHRHGPR